MAVVKKPTTNKGAMKYRPSLKVVPRKILEAASPVYCRPTLTPNAPVKKRKYQPLSHLFRHNKVSKMVLTPIAKKKKTVRWASPVKKEQFEDSMFAGFGKTEKHKTRERTEFVEQKDDNSHLGPQKSVRKNTETKAVFTAEETKREVAKISVPLSQTKLDNDEIVVEAMRRSLCALVKDLDATKRLQRLLEIKRTHASELKAMLQSHPDDLKRNVDVDDTGVTVSLAKYADLYERVGEEIEMLERAAYFACTKSKVHQSQQLHPMHNIGSGERYQLSDEDGERGDIAGVFRLVAETRQDNLTDVRRTIWQQLSTVRNADMELYADICKLIFDWSKGVKSIQLANALVCQLEDGSGCLRDIVEVHLSKLQSTDFFAKYASHSKAWHEELSDLNDLRLILSQILDVIRQIEGLVELDEYDSIDEDSIELSESEKEDEN